MTSSTEAMKKTNVNILKPLAPGIDTHVIVRVLGDAGYNCTVPQSLELAALVDSELSERTNLRRYFGLTDRGLLKELEKHITKRE